MRVTPANDESHGPFRAVVSIQARQVEWPRQGSGQFRSIEHEVLECGHPGRIVLDGLGRRRRAAKRRRCWPCGHALQLAAKEKQLDEWPGEEPAYSGSSVLAGVKAGMERGMPRFLCSAQKRNVAVEALTPEDRAAEAEAKARRAKFRVI